MKTPLITLGALLAGLFRMLLQPQASLSCSPQVEGEIIVEYRFNKDNGPLHAPSGATISGTPQTFTHLVQTKAKVCFYEGQTTVLGVTHKVDMLQKQDVKILKNSTDCSPIHRTKQNLRIIRPGNWERTVEEQITVFLEAAQAEREFKLDRKYRPFFTMVSIPGAISGSSKAPSTGACRWAGRYQCVFEAAFYSATTGYSLRQKHNVCTGETKEERLEFEPVPPGQQGTQGAPGPIPDNTIVLTNPYALVKLPGTFGSWAMDFDPRGCRGSHTLFKDKKPHLEQSCVVRWNFKPKDPCGDLIQMILNDLAYTQAFLDPETRKKTADIEKYKHYVDQKAYEIHQPEPSPWGESDPMGDEIGVNGECELVYQGKQGKEAEEAYRQDTLKGCTAIEVAEAILAHERTHQFQCRTDKARYNKADTEIWGNMEVAAHLAGIEKMLESLKQLCPQYDTSMVEEKINQINKERVKDRRVP